jgi:hypothetical protein
MVADWDPRCGGEKMRSNDGDCKPYDLLDMRPMWLGEEVLSNCLGSIPYSLVFSAARGAQQQQDRQMM